MIFRKKLKERRALRFEFGLHGVNVLVYERFAYRQMNEEEFELLLHHLESELQDARIAFQRRFKEAPK